jgi:hypothetical protein
LEQADIACCSTYQTTCYTGGPPPDNTFACTACNLINTRNGGYGGPAFQNSCTEEWINQQYPGFLTQYPNGANNGCESFVIGMGGHMTAAGYPLSYSGNSIMISYIPDYGYYSCGQQIPEAVAEAIINQTF